MDSDTNIGARIIGAIICIVIGIGSFQIAYETYEEIQSTIDLLDDVIDTRSKIGWNNMNDDWRRADWKRDVWYKTRTRQESSQYAILYSSVFVFCISLSCFTYICVKK